MSVLVVYESMFGNTHTIADRIGAGLAGVGPVIVSPVDAVTPELVGATELLVVGGPTHVHGMARPQSQASAVEQAAADDDLELDADAEGELLREWFERLAVRAGLRAAAFDTRVGPMSAAITGRASKGIAKRLRKHGCLLVAEAESFLVDKQNHLLDGEADRARAWGESLARSFEGQRA